MAGARPIATVLYYGPDDTAATRCVITIHAPGGAPIAARRWAAERGDLRRDAALADEMVAFVKAHAVSRTVFGEGIWGCEHEAAEGFPEGGRCDACEFWLAQRAADP